MNYVTHDFELGVVIHALKMWRHYLMGRRILLLTDNNGVKYLFSQLDLNVRKARWLAFLSKFDFKVRHIKGKENKVEDSVSRRTNAIYEIIVSKEENDIEQRIKSASYNFKNYIKQTTKLQENAEKMNKTYMSLDKTRLIRFKNRLYVPNSVDLKSTILDELQKQPSSGYLGY
jgi:hypothetical protein